MSGLNNKLVGQIGEYLVCAELGRRGLIATPFAGNVPAFDIIAVDERCRAVPIQVKASSSDNWPTDARSWINLELDAQTQVQQYNGLSVITNPELIYVCVAIAKAGERDRFFVLTKADIQRVCAEVYSAFMEPKGWKRPRNPASYDCRYKFADLAEFEDNWNLITQRFEASLPEAPLANEETPIQEVETPFSSSTLDAILRFLPVFDRTDANFGEWIAEKGHFPYFSASKEVNDFIAVLYEHDIIYSFDWSAWIAKEGKRYAENDSALADADLLTLRNLLTAHVRADRFNEGHLASMFQMGHIAAILCRLWQLRAEMS